jgi:hypothetical protein
VVKLDLVGQTKRVKFHFPRLEIKHDEWIEIYSSRVASLYSKTPPPLKKDPPKSEPSFSLKEKKTKKEKKQNGEKKRKMQSLESSEEEFEFSETDNFSVDNEWSPQSHPGADVDLNVPAKNGSSEEVKKKLKKLKKLNKSKKCLPEKTTESSPATKSSPEHSVGRDPEPKQDNLQKDENGFMRIPRKTSSPKKQPSTQDPGIVKKDPTAVPPESGQSPVEAAASPSGTRIPRKSSSGPKISEAASLVAVVKAEQGKVPSKTGTDESQFSLRRPTEPYNSSQLRSSEDKYEYAQQKMSQDEATGETTAARKLPLGHTQDHTFFPGHASEGRSNREPSRRSSSSQRNLATDASSTKPPEDIDRVQGHVRDYRYSHGADRVNPKSSQEPYRQGSYRDSVEKHETGRQSSQDRYAQGFRRETFDDNGKSHQGSHQRYDNDSRREYADEVQDGYRRGAYRESDEDHDRSRRGSKDRYNHGSYRDYDEDYDRPRQGSHGGLTRGSHRECGEDYDRPRQGSHGGYNRGSYREYGEDYDRPRQGSRGDYSRGSHREYGYRDYDNQGSQNRSSRDLYREYGEAYDKPRRSSKDRYKSGSFRDMASPRKKSLDRGRSSHRDERPQDAHHLPAVRLPRNEPCRGNVANIYDALPDTSPRVVSESPLDFRGAEKKMNGDHR